MVLGLHRRSGSMLFAVLVALLSALMSAPAAFAAGEAKPYIVVLEDSVAHPGHVAERHRSNRGAEVSHVYRSALKGYSAAFLPGEAKRVASDPSVAYVEPDGEVSILAQTVPTGVQRVFAATNAGLDIDGGVDAYVDADVAVIDTGIDFDHPDLRVVARTDCTAGPPCLDGSGDDQHGHGTHVAGIAAARDNDRDVVGVAPGARLWGVRVLEGASGTWSDVIAGVDWVTAHAGQIEVANMSLGDGEKSQALAEAIAGSVDAGVVYTVAAGNWGVDAAEIQPANHPDVITVSALTDWDGKPGGVGSPPVGNNHYACKEFDEDDTLATFFWLSDIGETVEVIAPGVCILSTAPGGGVRYSWGTSMASPHVAGAAAILASADNPQNQADVEAIRETIVEEGNASSRAEGGWDDESEDGFKEPLLDVSDETVFDPTLICGSANASDTDLDGDCRADLVTVDSEGTAHVFAGTATGIAAGSSTESLQGQVDPALLDGKGHYPTDVADVTGDGRADLVTVRENSEGFATTYVHRGKADRTFAAAVATTLTATEAGSKGYPLAYDGQSAFLAIEPIDFADVTGDGRADLIVHQSVPPLGSYLRVYPAQEGGGFGWPLTTQTSAKSALLTNSGHYFAGAADMTGDGRPDVVSLSTDGSAYVHKGKAGGAPFEAPVKAAAINPIMDDGSGQEPVGVADLTADGKADLLTLDGATLKLWAGKADGTLAAATSAYAGSIDSSLTDGSGQELVGLLDYSRDGRPDLVAIRDDGDVLTYAAQAGGTFAAPTTSEAGLDTVRHVGPAGHEPVSEKPLIRRAGCTAQGCRWHSAPKESDADGDGRADLITVDSQGTAHVYPGTATGIAASGSTESLSGQIDPALLDGVGHYLTDVADVTGEGRSDLVTVKENASGLATAYVHRGRTDRTFAPAVQTVLAASEAGSSGYPLIYDGQASFLALEPVAVADVTADGRADLIAHQKVPFTGAAFRIYPGQASGGFGAPLTSTAPAGASALLTGTGQHFAGAADVTGDKLADVVSLSTDGSAYVHKAKAGGTFEAPVKAATINPIMDDGVGQEPVGVADVTADGRADLLTLDGSALKLWAGKADGTLAAATSAYAGSINSSLLDGSGQELIGLLDYSRDGRADLVAVRDDGDVLTYAAQSNGTFASPVSAAGDLATVRHVGPGGHEPVSEKPLTRRAGCTAGGCDWPPGS